MPTDIFDNDDRIRVIGTTTWPVLSDIAMAMESGLSRQGVRECALGSIIKVDGKPFTKMKPDYWKGPERRSGTHAQEGGAE